MARHDDDDDDDDSERVKLRAPPDFDGPLEDRYCTDVLLLLLLLGMWVAMTGVGLYAVEEGDYRKIVFPLDYDGNICGTDFGALDMTDYPLLYYVNSYTGGVCVKECPDVSKSLADNGIDVPQGTVTDVRTLITYGGLYQVEGSTLPADFIQIGDYSNSSDAVDCTPELCFPDPNDPTSSWTAPGISRGFGIAYYAGDTYELLYRCYYTIAAEDQIAEQVVASGEDGGGLDPMNKANDFFNDLYGDLYVARQYIAGFGLGLCLGVSFIYIFLMRIPLLLKTLVWTSILLTTALFLIGGYYTYNLAQDWEDEDPQTVDDTTITATRIAGIVLYVIGGILILLGCCLRRQIAIAIGCVKTAGKAVNHMFLMLLIPVLQAIGMFAFMVVWVSYAVNLASLGDITTTELDLPGTDLVQVAVRQYEWSPFVVRCGWFLLFCLFWTANFIVAMGDLMIAMSVAKYYFTRNKWKVGSWTVLHSVWQVIRYHVGTAAYGSLLIAVVQVIRAAIARAQRAAKKSNSKIGQCVLCCCQCCFAMMECCLKFISKNAYIQTAIFSTAFCKSCRKAFYLITRNVARIAAVTYVSSAVLIIGKLFIASLTTLVGYYFVTEDLSDELHSTAGPTIFIFLLSYWVSDFFMDIFDVAITAVLHCFIADEEMFTDQVYADADLRKFIDEHGADKD